MKPKWSPRAGNEEQAFTEINMSQIRVGGGIAGLLFAAGTVLIFLIGIPAVRWFFAGAAVTGGIIAMILRVFHDHSPVRISAPIN